VEGFDVIRLHNPSDTMLATGLAGFSQVEKDARGAVDTMARHIGHADQAEQPLILQRSIGERMSQPFIEPAARHAEETTHDGSIKFATMGLDERVLHSDTLRSASIAHGTPFVLTTHLKVSVKAWEVQLEAQVTKALDGWVMIRTKEDLIYFGSDISKY